MDHALQVRSIEHSVRIERSVGSLKKETTEMILPQIANPESSDKDMSKLDNQFIGLLPAAQAFVRARRKNDADDEETKLEEDKENKDTTNIKIPVLFYRRVHQIFAGESLVSIAESKLKDANLA